MKLSIIIDEKQEEEIVIRARRENDLVKKIRHLVEEEPAELLGYNGQEIFRLNRDEICCFVSESNGVFAITEGKRLKVKQRLYQLEETLDGFIKINQSCLANISKIEKFEATPFGALTVIFKGGYRDFVSRRNLKNIKERFGF